MANSENTGIVLSPLSIRPNTEDAERHDKEKLMSTALKAISDRWLKELSQENINNLDYFYRRCKDAKMIAERPGEYGDDGLERLFDRCSLARDTIQKYINVANRIDQETFDAIQTYNQQAPSGGKLPFSPGHLDRLGRIADSATRMELLRQCAEEGWKVETLSDRVSKAIANDPEVGASNRVSTEIRPTAVTNKIQQIATKLEEASASLDSDEFLERLDAVKSHDVEKLLHNVRSARENFEAISAKLADRINRLSSAEQALLLRLENLSKPEKSDAEIEFEKSVAATAERRPAKQVKKAVVKKVVKKVVKRSVAPTQPSVNSSETPGPVKKLVKKKLVKKAVVRPTN
jgi:uncharacterized protein (DUF2132 family)